MAEAARPFRVELAGLSAFPSSARPQTVWIGSTRAGSRWRHWHGRRTGPAPGMASRKRSARSMPTDAGTSAGSDRSGGAGSQAPRGRRGAGRRVRCGRPLPDERFSLAARAGLLGGRRLLPWARKIIEEIPTLAIAADKQKTLEMALAQIEKQFGKGSIMRLGRRAPSQHRGHSDRLDRARYGPGRGRRAARPRHRDLRPGILGQDDAGAAHRRRGAEAGRHRGVRRRRARA